MQHEKNIMRQKQPLCPLKFIIHQMVIALYYLSVVASIIYGLKVGHIFYARNGEKILEQEISTEKSNFHCRKNQLLDMLPTTIGPKVLSFSQTLESSNLEPGTLLPDRNEQ